MSVSILHCKVPSPSLSLLHSFEGSHSAAQTERGRIYVHLPDSGVSEDIIWSFSAQESCLLAFTYLCIQSFQYGLGIFILYLGL
jgi:hypothetical protein